MQPAELPPVRRTLYLETAVAGLPCVIAAGIDGVSLITVTVGEGEVTGIEPGKAPGSYDVHVGSRLINVPAHKVDHFEQDPRPGFVQAERDAARGFLPSFAVPLNDGTFDCKACGYNARTVHALKIHNGRAHGDER